MKRILVILFLVGIASSQYAATQIRVVFNDVGRRDAAAPAMAMTPGGSKSLVLIDARVTDETGKYVQGLQAEDFELYQDGRQQEIAQFYELDRTNTDVDPRTVVFLIDDLGLSKAKFNQVRTALKNFAEKVMTPADLVAIAQTSGGGFVLQPLTSDNHKVQSLADHWQWCVEAAKPFGGLAQIYSSNSGFIRACSGST